MTPDLAGQLRQMLHKSHRSLAAAKMHIQNKDYDFAASRSYYAAFYAMEASLLAEGITCSTHNGVLTEFSAKFIKTMRLPQSFGAKATRLFRERQVGDYDFDAGIDEADAIKNVEIASEIIAAITALLFPE